MDESMRLATRVILAAYADIRKADESYLVKKSPYLKILVEIKKVLESCPTVEEYARVRFGESDKNDPFSINKPRKDL